MRETILIGLVGAALGLCACAPNTAAYAGDPPAEAHQVKVLAADRLVVDGVSVVLADAQAPQPAPGAACPAEVAAARRAIQAVGAALAGARHLEVQSADAQGGLRLVNIDGLDLGQTLISEGVAVDRGGTSMDWCQRAANLARLASPPAAPLTPRSRRLAWRARQDSNLQPPA